MVENLYQQKVFHDGTEVYKVTDPYKVTDQDSQFIYDL